MRIIVIRDEVAPLYRGNRKVVRRIDRKRRLEAEEAAEEYSYPFLCHKSTDRFYKEKKNVIPQFLNRLEDQWHHHDDNITLRVAYKGEPDPVVHWFKDQQPIESTIRTMITAGDGMTELVIFDAQKCDAGFYTCRIENFSGVRETNCHIHIGDNKNTGRKPIPADYRLYRSILYTPSQRYSRF